MSQRPLSGQHGYRRQSLYDALPLFSLEALSFPVRRACAGVFLDGLFRRIQSHRKDGGSGGSGSGTGGSNLACNVMSVGQTASLNGFVPFSSSSLWNTDISSAPVDPNSNTIIRTGWAQ